MDKKINARKKAQRLARQRKMRNRRIALTICLMLAICLVSVGGTIAWLTAESKEVTNVFTVGDINIELKEHVYDGEKLGTGETDKNENYKMVPGDTLEKDPFVRVKANSESSWLFVEIVESNSVANFISYSVDTEKWVDLGEEGEHGGKVYAYKTAVDATGAKDSDPYYILAKNEVTVKNSVTKEMLDGVGTNKPTLTFYAYACQSANVGSYTAAWANVKNPAPETT